MGGYSKQRRREKTAAEINVRLAHYSDSMPALVAGV